jgi:hypothetical protein
MNVVGSRDWVVNFVGMMKILFPRRLARFGEAGLKGFAPTDTIHDVTDPPTCSAGCASWFSPGAIHNLWFAFDHWEALENLPHQVAYWLPFLWGIDISLYSELRLLCESARRSEESFDPQSLKRTEYLIATHAADWANGTVQAFLRQLVLANPHAASLSADRLEDAGLVAIRFFWKLMLRASYLASKAVENARPGSGDVLALRPHICASWAAERAVLTAQRMAP